MAGLRKPKTYKVNRVKNRNVLKKKTVFYNIGEGTHRLRVVPPMNKDGLIFTKATNHFGFESEDGFNIAPACTCEHGDGTCWICDLINYLYSTGDSGDEKVAKRIKASSKWFVQAFVWDGEKYDGPYLVGLSKRTADDVNDLFDQLEALGEPDFCDVEKGSDLVITRRGTGMTDTRYTVGRGTLSSDLNELVPDWAERVFPDMIATIDPRIMDAAAMRDAAVRTYGDGIDWEVVDKEVPVGK